MGKYVEKVVRLLIIGIGVIAEIVIAYEIFHYFTRNFAWIEALLRLLSMIIVVYIVNNSRHLSTDMFWILLIMMLPVPGTVIYLLLGADLLTSKTARSLYSSSLDSQKYLKQDSGVIKEMEEKMSNLKGDFHFISAYSGYPFYRNGSTDYYRLGNIGFPVMLEALENAKEFIFLEYFIIREGKMWNSIHEVLKRKAAEGVDVRVIYDDVGSIRSLPVSYTRKLESENIKCVRFNKINPVIGAVINHRDHRKILVVDGKIAFSGGINLADEYINEKILFGRWKDNCIRIKGDAVWTYTVLFLRNWNALRKTDDDYEVFRRKCELTEYDGYIAPYAGGPFEEERIGQCIYTNIITSARDYVYISTPYLMIDNELENALILAAKKGIDVRILTPGIPDKKLIWWISRSYYSSLIENGVKVYEYTPGFNHAKIFVSDDKVATIGTFNLDYRSLYLHFENGTYLCESKTVLDVRNDFIEAIGESRYINRGDIKINLAARLLIGFAKLFVSQL